MKKYLYVAFCTLLAACAGQPDRGVMRDDSGYQLGSTLRADSNAMFVSVLAVPEKLAVMDMIGNLQKDFGKKSRDEQMAVMMETTHRIAVLENAGQIERFDGQLAARILFLSVKPLPQQLPYFGGNNLYRGMVPVEQIKDGLYQVRIPVEGGRWGGKAGVLVPRGIFATEVEGAAICMAAEGGHLAYSPPLKAGSFKDVPDVICSFLVSRSDAMKSYILLPFVVEKQRS